MVVTGTLSTHNIPFDHKQDTLLTKNFLHWFIVLRILFLCGYELFFRGFLLFDCIQWLGIPWAITISTGLTVLIHVFNGKKEMWACIPFGIILCSCCIAVHAVWPAIILHIALAMSHELTLIAQFLTKLKPAK